MSLIPVVGSATPKSKALVPSRVSWSLTPVTVALFSSGVREASGSDVVNGVMFYLRVSCFASLTGENKH